MNCQSLYLQRIQKKAAMEMASGNIRHVFIKQKLEKKMLAFKHNHIQRN